MMSLEWDETNYIQIGENLSNWEPRNIQNWKGEKGARHLLFSFIFCLNMKTIKTYSCAYFKK